MQQPPQQPPQQQVYPDQHQSPVPDHLADDAQGGAMAGGELIYPGEIYTTGISLAVRLPGDNTESWFSAKHTAVCQPGESYADVINRTIATSSQGCWASIDEVLDVMNQNQQEAVEQGAQARTGTA